MDTVEKCSARECTNPAHWSVGIVFHWDETSSLDFAKIAQKLLLPIQMCDECKDKVKSVRDLIREDCWESITDHFVEQGIGRPSFDLTTLEFFDANYLLDSAPRNLLAALARVQHAIEAFEQGQDRNYLVTTSKFISDAALYAAGVFQNHPGEQGLSERTDTANKLLLLSDVAQSVALEISMQCPKHEHDYEAAEASNQAVCKMRLAIKDVGESVMSALRKSAGWREAN